MLPQNGELQLEPTPTHSKKFKSFAQWMEARNIYVSTVLLAKPSKALEMLGYQCIIASLNLCFPITTWMTHDIKFCSFTASYPILRWNIQHLDTCLAHTVAVCATIQSAVLFMQIHLQLMLIDSYLPLGMPHTPFPSASTHNLHTSPNNHSHSHQICKDFNNWRSYQQASCFFCHVYLQCYGPHPQYVYLPHHTSGSACSSA